MKIGELFMALGFEVDDKKLKEYNSAIDDTRRRLTQITTLAAAAVTGLYLFASGGIEAATAMRNFNTQTGESIDQLQQWQVAATMSNTALSVDQVTQSIVALSGAISDVSMGKGPSGPFAMLGIDTRGKDSFMVLEEMRRRYQDNVAQWGQRQTNDLMMQTGIDPGLINAIQLSREEFDALVGDRILSAESRNKLIILGETIQRVKQDWVLFKNDMSARWTPVALEAFEAALPALREFSKNVGAVASKLAEVATQTKQFVTELPTAIKIGLGGLVVFLAPITSTIAGLIYLTNEWGKSLRGLPAFQAISDNLERLAKFFGLDEESKNEAAKQEFDRRKREHDQRQKEFNFIGPETPEEWKAGKRPLMPGQESLFYGDNYEPMSSPPANDVEGWYSSKTDRQPPAPPQPASIQNTANINNTYNIEGNFSADEVADEVRRMQEGTVSSTMNEFNNGVRY